MNNPPVSEGDKTKLLRKGNDQHSNKEVENIVDYQNPEQQQQPVQQK